MSVLLTRQDVVDLHEQILNPKELTGFAGDKSLDGALGRVAFRLQYGSIQDDFDLAAAYGVALAQGHVFNDGNKRTAFSAMDMCLYLNGIKMEWGMKVAGDIIIEVAQGNIDEVELATWLRKKASQNNHNL